MNQVMSLDVRKATIDESDVIFDLWIDSVKWLKSKGIDQWDPNYF